MVSLNGHFRSQNYVTCGSIRVRLQGIALIGCSKDQVFPKSLVLVDRILLVKSFEFVIKTLLYLSRTVLGEDLFNKSICELLLSIITGGWLPTNCW